MLVDYAVHKPKLIYQLLTSIGTHVHPKILIEKIELGLEIPHLKKALAIIMQDYRLQVTLQVQFDPPKMVLSEARRSSCQHSVGLSHFKNPAFTRILAFDMQLYFREHRGNLG